MAKISAKDGVILIGGYNLSTYASAYDIDMGQDKLDCTGFGDGWQNYVSGIYLGSMTLAMMWDSAAGKSVAALKPLANKCVTIMPDGYALGNPVFSMHSEQDRFGPGGKINDLLTLGSIQFVTSGIDGGPCPAYALQHGTTTTTLTGTAFQGLASAGTYRGGGFLHIWQACAADTYAVKIRHCATAGGTYADLVTFTLNGSAIGSEHVLVASGTIQPYWRVEATRTGSAGNTFGFSCTFWCE